MTHLSSAIGLLFSTHLQANHDIPGAARECLLDHFANVSWALDATHHWYFQPDGELLQLNYGQQDYRLGHWQMDATG
ncbi:MAG: hypothetical protein KDC54_00525, partial [Lewinella sp.]|nr:hypothetical protein [Lewinella sp.]